MKTYTHVVLMLTLSVTAACTTPKVILPGVDERTPPDSFEVKLNSVPLTEYRVSHTSTIFRDIPVKKQNIVLAKVQDSRDGVSEISISIHVECHGAPYGSPPAPVFSKTEFVTASDAETAGPGDEVDIYRLAALNFRLYDVESRCEYERTELPWHAKILVTGKNYFNRPHTKIYHADLHPIR